MHPNPLFRCDDEALVERLVADIGFGAVFLTTPDGPRVSHTPLLAAGPRRWRFHLARGNALARHLDGAQALVSVQGPDGYVSPRWYADRATVPTWDYVAVELEGTVRRLDAAELDAFLYDVIELHEARLGGEAWSHAETPPEMWQSLSGMIAGFELAVEDMRPTLKLSQKRNTKERATIAAGLEAAGRAPLAALMRELAL